MSVVEQIAARWSNMPKMESKTCYLIIGEGIGPKGIILDIDMVNGSEVAETLAHAIKDIATLLRIARAAEKSLVCNRCGSNVNETCPNCVFDELRAALRGEGDGV